MLKALKIQLNLEIEKTILEDLFKINSHHWILCRFHTQVISKLGVYTTILTHSRSSLLTPKTLGDPIPLKTQSKLVSLIKIEIQKSKPNLHLCQSMHIG